MNMKVAYRCSFSTFICHLHWYLQHFVRYLSSEAPVRSKVVFSLARSVCPKLHDFSQLFGQVGMVAQIASPHEAPNIRYQLFTNATSRSVFDMERSRQCFFKTLPPTVDTLCASDHYTKLVAGCPEVLRVKHVP